MANTYTKMHLQFVFAVKYRKSLIAPSWKDEMYKYITGIIQNQDHKLLAINGMPDHIHILVGMRPAQSVSDLLQDIKSGSSKWVNEQNFCKEKFEWQSGFGAFSYGASQVSQVIRYIENQEQHHMQVSFREEYMSFLEKFEIEYNEKHIFQEPQ